MPQFDADREQAVARARAAGVETMLIVGGVDAEAGHRRAVTRRRAARPARLRRRASARSAAGDARDLRRAARARARQADRRHRRDRPRLPLRPLAARRPARGLPRAGPPGPRRRPARHHPHPRGRRRDGGAARGRGRAPAASSTASPAATTWPAEPSPSASTSRSRGSWPSRGRRSSRRSRGRCLSTGCSWRRTPRSWLRRPIGASATSPRSWWRWRGRWPRCAAITVEEIGRATAANFRAALRLQVIDNAGRIRQRSTALTSPSAIITSVPPRASRRRGRRMVASGSVARAENPGRQLVRRGEHRGPSRGQERHRPGHEGDHHPLRPQGHELEHRARRARRSSSPPATSPR